MAPHQDPTLEIPPPDHPSLTLEFCERFTERTLSTSRWIPHYLPHWTTPERSVARYALNAGELNLQILAEQPAWLPSDSMLRVSNLQTGSFSGPLGSNRGQSRHRSDLVVQTPQPTVRLYAPNSPARVEATLRATADPTCMLAFWLYGFEETSAEESGEICVVELFGDRTGSGGSRVGAELSIGVKKHSDPNLKDEMEEIVIDGFDACEWHTYGAEWDTNEVRFYVDAMMVKVVPQGFTYEMQLTVSLFEFPIEGQERDPNKYPKMGYVKDVLGFRHL
ncbi:hypothetical protein ACEPPN_001429 [Leptodophora sp. 'Broadleaf-Isolate-01']